MNKIIEQIEQRQLRPEVPQFKAGDTVRVHFKVIEGQRQRIQVFEGIVIKRQGAGVRETFTVRKSSFGVGVERTFPLHSPKINKIDVISIGDVNRAKLYYLRAKIGKKARVRAKLEQRVSKTAVATPEAVEPENVEPEAAEPAKIGKKARVRAKLEQRGTKTAVATPEAVEPENVEPEAAEPESVEPENVEPGSAEPTDGAEPENVESDAAEATESSEPTDAK